MKLNSHKMKSKLGAAILAVLFITALTAMTDLKIQQDPWEVPVSAKKMKNPTDPGDSEGLMVGKSLYSKHCKSCHGKTGKGDGPKAAELETPCGDFTSSAFQSQTDGELFYKTKEGRDDMPGFKKKITEDEDIWYIVNHLRTL